MFKLTFQYFNRYGDDRLERTVWGETKKAAYASAYEIALQDGDGEFWVTSLYDFTRRIEA